MWLYRLENKCYQIGYYTPNPIDKGEFVVIKSVRSDQEAMCIVNYLNGGTGNLYERFS